MKILVVDDSDDAQKIIKHYIEKAGDHTTIPATSAAEAYRYLGINGESQNCPSIDILLLDVVLEDDSGLHVCKTIKADPRYSDLPILIMTSDHSSETLEEAFQSGAMDFIQKPLRKAELLARINSALQIKQEMDQRKQREQELLKSSRELKIANEVLQNLFTIDPLTSINNRGHFDMVYDQEWKRAKREKLPLCLVILDVDFFKLYNDTYGHQAGDNCLIRVADAISSSLHRAGDFAARYGGEEFVVLLPYTNLEGGKIVAEEIRQAILDLKIEHVKSMVSPIISISAGVCSLVPTNEISPEKLISQADMALYFAKKSGRNQVQQCDALPDGFSIT